MKIPFKIITPALLNIILVLGSCNQFSDDVALQGEFFFKTQKSGNSNEWVPILEENFKKDRLVKKLEKEGYIINGQLQVAKLDLEYLSAELPILQIAGMNIRYELNNRGKPVITVTRGGASYLLPVPASTAADQFFAGVSQVNPAEPALLFILKKIKEENGYSYLLQIYGGEGL